MLRSQFNADRSKSCSRNVVRRRIVRISRDFAQGKGRQMVETTMGARGGRKSRPVFSAKIQTSDKLSREMGYFIDRRKRKARGRERGRKGDSGGAGVTGGSARTGGGEDEEGQA